MGPGIETGPGSWVAEVRLGTFIQEYREQENFFKAALVLPYIFLRPACVGLSRDELEKGEEVGEEEEENESPEGK